jgi:hypothetical protein
VFKLPSLLQEVRERGAWEFSVVNLLIVSNMSKNSCLFTLFLAALVLTACQSNTEGFKTIRPDVLEDKIAGGWSGKMIGVTRCTD